MTRLHVLENNHIRLAFDELGRITSFVNKANGTELLPYSGLEDNWKIMILTGGYPVQYVLGKDQTPKRITQNGEALTIFYEGLKRGDTQYNINLEFTAWLDGDEAKFQVWLKNGTDQRIREVWAPILGGFQGFNIDNKTKMVDFCHYGNIAKDVLHNGLPGAEYLFVVEGETADYRYVSWLDMFTEKEGLYIASDNRKMALQVIRVEKHPSEMGTSGGSLDERHFYPPDTTRWMKLSIGELTTIDPGEEWTTPASIFWPHQGDWHRASGRFRAWMDSWVNWPARPSWLKSYTGWQHIIGKTYLDEVYHTFEQFTQLMIEAQKRTGVNVLMLYGHTDIGCEGANYDLTPGDSLGGPDGFKRMCEELHQRNMHVNIFTHRQSAIAMDRPEFQVYKDWAFRNRLGIIRTEEWWKTTIESLTYRTAGTGPIWSRICPYCDEWWYGFLEEIRKLNDLGCDGVQMDTIGAEGSICYATNHGHKPGELMMPKLLERLAWLRKEVYAMNPEFLLAGEEEHADFLQPYIDLPYSRLRGNDGFQVFGYTFPEARRNVAVGAYSYDQVNKGFMMGWGFNCEVEGLKKSILTYPDFADFVGEVNKVRLEHSEYLLDGRFIDTLKARVEGNVRYAVHQGPKGYAVVVWNQNDTQEACTVTFEDDFERGLLCEPGKPEAFLDIPCSLMLKPHSSVAIIAEM